MKSEFPIFVYIFLTYTGTGSCVCHINLWHFGKPGSCI